MIVDKQKDIARWAMDKAKEVGCQASRVSLLTAISNSYEQRNEQLDELTQSAENKLFVELYIDGKYGSFSTNRLEQGGIGKLIEDGANATRYLAEDKCQQLPDSNRYCKDSSKSLDVCDDSYYSINTEDKLDLIRQSVHEIYGTNDKILSVSASYSDSIGAEYMIASNGLEVETTDTSFTLVADVSLMTDGHARAEDYWFDSSIYWSDLKKQGIAQEALKRALRKSGQQKIKSGKYTMLLDNTVAGRMLSPLIGAMSGGALQQKSSFLINKLGTQITSPKLTVIDCPHAPRTMGARWYDGEGVATRQLSVIENGMLNTYFINTYNALKMDVEPTIGGSSMLTVNCGTRGFDELLRGMDKGIWITGFNGGNSNPTTGDFSFGIEGFFVENGVITTPINEMNVTGDFLSLWQNLEELGNDVNTQSRHRLPSLVFNDVNFSGL